VSVVCADLGSCGLQTEEQGTQVLLTAYFAAEHARPDLWPALAAAVRRLGVDPEFDLSVTVEEDWDTAWRRGLGPVQATPRIIVHPSWCPVAAAPPQVSVCIDPKMAFGTGGHETTRLCLRALEELVDGRSCCLDLGTGSGILAIAAAKLGAACVLALDTDPRAVENARENLTLNGVDDGRIEVLLGSLECAGGRTFSLIVANIQRSVLVPLLAGLANCLTPGGHLVLSGLLAPEVDACRQAVGAAGLRVVRGLAEGEWACLVGTRAQIDA
jgi:ribosomal protein L11 methyltransferase